MTTTPGETPNYFRPVYANQAAANGAVIDRFTEHLRRVRRALNHDMGKSLQELVYVTGHSVVEVERAVEMLVVLGLAAEHYPAYYYAKDVPNG